MSHAAVQDFLVSNGANRSAANEQQAASAVHPTVERIGADEVLDPLVGHDAAHEEDVAAIDAQRRQSGEMDFSHPESAGGYAAAPNALDDQAGAPEEAPEAHTPYVREEKKVGRNEPCPCGSGKKYKQCHGKLR